MILEDQKLVPDGTIIQRDIEYVENGQVTATNSEQDQSVTYCLAPSGAADLFSIDPSTGQIEFDCEEIYFRNAYNLDHAFYRNYWFNVIARDNGDVPGQTQSRVTVHVHYPAINITPKELRMLKQIYHALRKGKELSSAQSKRLNNIRRTIHTLKTNDPVDPETN